MIIDTFNQVGWLLPLTLITLSLCVGSFLNVVIYRLPVMMEARWRSNCCELLEIEQEKQDQPLSLAFPNSHCPRCNTPIKPWHNVPVISYLLLRGKCAQCAVSISPRYPLLEVTTAALSVVLLWHFALGPALLGALLFTWALIALTMIDVDHQLLPDEITLPLLWAGLLFNSQAVYVGLESAVLGAVFGYLILWSVYWLFKLVTGKEGMGYGDFKLLAALGAWMGWESLHMIILMSSLVGAVVGIALLIVKRQGKDVPIPFGPYLAAAGWITFLWAGPIMQAVPLLNLWQQ